MTWIDVAIVWWWIVVAYCIAMIMKVGNHTKDKDD